MISTTKTNNHVQTLAELKTRFRPLASLAALALVVALGDYLFWDFPV